MVSQTNTFKLIDGYAMQSDVRYTIYSDWIDTHSCSLYSLTVVFTTSDSPTGTISLELSNDRKWTGATVVQPLIAAEADNSSGVTKSVSDIKTIPSGTGTASATVFGSKTFILNQWYPGFRWVRMKYAANSNITAQLDAFMHMKNF